MSPQTSKPPCAACKFQRRKCNPDCVFAPYFPANDPQKFIKVHQVFGASNVSKILSDLAPNVRAEASESLVYEAAFRLHEPVYGCVGLLGRLQEVLAKLYADVASATMELASYTNIVAPPPPPPTQPVQTSPPINMQQQPTAFGQQYVYDAQTMYPPPPHLSCYDPSSLPYTSRLFQSMSMDGAGPSTSQYGVDPSSSGVNIINNEIQQHGDDNGNVHRGGLGLQAEQVGMQPEETGGGGSK